METHADTARALIERAAELADMAPDLARELLSEGSALVAEAGVNGLSALICETMGRIAIGSGAFDVAGEPLSVALESYLEAGELKAAARVEAALAFLSQPHPFEDEADALHHELTLIRALLDHATEGAVDDEAALVHARTWLDLRRRLPMADGIPPSTFLLARAFDLDPVSLALLMAVAAAELDVDLAGEMRVLQKAGGWPRLAFLTRLVAPSLVPAVHSRSFREDLPLRRHRLVEVVSGTARLDPEVRDFLQGRRALGESIRERAVLLEPPDGAPRLPPALAVQFEEVCVLVAAEPGVQVVLTGPAGSGRQVLASAIAQTLGARVLHLASGCNDAELLRIAARDACLHESYLAIEVPPELGPESALAVFLEDYEPTVFLLAVDETAVEGLGLVDFVRLQM